MFEDAAKGAGIFDTVECVDDLSGAWRSEFKLTKTKADARSYSIAALASRDEAPVSALVLGGSKAAVGRAEPIYRAAFARVVVDDGAQPP